MSVKKSLVTKPSLASLVLDKEPMLPGSRLATCGNRFAALMSFEDDSEDAADPDRVVSRGIFPRFFGTSMISSVMTRWALLRL